MKRRCETSVIASASAYAAAKEPDAGKKSLEADSRALAPCHPQGDAVHPPFRIDFGFVAVDASEILPNAWLRGDAACATGRKLPPRWEPAMKLIGMLDSPYVRRVAISLQLLPLSAPRCTATRPTGMMGERARLPYPNPFPLTATKESL